MYLAVALGLVAGFLFAASAALQQHVARRTATTKGTTYESGRKSIVGPLITLTGRLVRRPPWLLGWCTNLIGFLVQAAALHLGSVALVQPLLVTQLLFAMPLSTAWARRWPTFIEWLGVILISGGLAIFVLVRAGTPNDGEADRSRLILAIVIAVALVGLLVTLAAGRSSLVHATLLSIGAGLCFAVSAVLMKLTTDDLLHRGVLATALDWPGYSLAVSTLVGLFLEQGAFATGSLSAAVAAMTITNPLASYLLGVLAFRVVLPHTPGVLAGLAVSGALLILGIAALSRSPTVLRPDPVADDDGTEPRIPQPRSAPQITEPSSTPDQG